MPRALAILVVLMLSGASLAAERRAPFPDPFSMDTPETPPRAGGLDFRYQYHKGLTTLAFPLVSGVNTRKNDFTTQIFLPLGVVVPDGGEAEFIGGDPRIALKGAWTFDITAGHETWPAALSAGGDFNLPLSALWGNRAVLGGEGLPVSVEPVMGMIPFSENPVGWIPGMFGIAPRASFAVGPEIFFGEVELAFPLLVPARWYDFEAFFTWALAAGSKPHEQVVVFFEMSGLVSMARENPIGGVFRRNQLYATLGGRVFLGKFECGLMIRLPFVDPWNLAGTGTTVTVGLYLGAATGD